MLTSTMHKCYIYSQLRTPPTDALLPVHAAQCAHAVRTPPGARPIPLQAWHGVPARSAPFALASHPLTVDTSACRNDHAFASFIHEASDQSLPPRRTLATAYTLHIVVDTSASHILLGVCSANGRVQWHQPTSWWFLGLDDTQVWLGRHRHGGCLPPKING